MSSFLQLTLTLVILITVAKLSGYVSMRLGQPSVLGELLAGLLLGPTLIDLLHWGIFTDEHLAETIGQMAELGVLLLMFIAGLDLHLTDLVKSGRVSVMAGLLGVFVPVGMGYGLGMIFQMDPLPSIFLGLVLAATSVSISAQTLMELGVLRTKVGIGMLGAAVFDDILVVLGLSIAIAFSTASGGFLAILWIVLKMVFFIVAGIGLGMILVPRLARWTDRMPISQGLIAFTLTTMLLYAWGSEVIGGMAAITGAFLAGLVFSRSKLKERIESGFSTLAYGLFVPIFFVNVGLHADLHELGGENIWLVLGLILAAIVSKIVGAGLGARLSGFDMMDSLRLGVGMMSRGEVGLIVAALGIEAGLLNPESFSGIVGVVLITTLLTPILLRSLFAKPPDSSKRDKVQTQKNPAVGD